MRPAIAGTGLLALVVGILILSWPDATVASLGILFGLYYLIRGIVHVGEDYSHRARPAIAGL
ncbi:DUF308 domain-containing protein [Cryobacterium sp. M23]|uniref:DUF308 domain-containing protein n=1 Tax=Cryobacterium sp. M23 TaxID=2048292 RepID=UPI001304DCA6|nr:DUF308 domain-containing protein [Cryobacterium sp. M23]